MPNWKKIVLSGSSATLSNLNVDNAVTASFFKGDGSGLTNVTTTVVENATVSDTFSSVTSKAVTHNFGTKDVLVSVYNNSDQLLIPATITTTTSNTVDITFVSSTTGRVVVAKGGHIVSGSAATAGNGFPFTGSAEITGSLTVTGSVKLTGQLKVGDLSQASTRDVSFDDRFNLLAANNQSANILFGDPDDDGKGSIRYSNSDDSFEFRTDGDSALIIDSNQTASFVSTVSASYFKGDGSQLTNINASAIGSGIGFFPPSNPSAGGNFELGTSYSLSVLNNGSGILSGSSQIDNLTRFEQTLTGATSYTITHNLNEDYPIVQVYDNSKFQVIPASVKVTNSNVVDLTFSTFANFEGKVVVKK